jgi:hypothetical protein
LLILTLGALSHKVIAKNYNSIQLKYGKESVTDTRVVKASKGVEVWLYAFLTATPDGGEWSASRAGRFTLEERANDTEQAMGLDEPQS